MMISPQQWPCRTPQSCQQPLSPYTACASAQEMPAPLLADIKWQPPPQQWGLEFCSCHRALPGWNKG